MLRWDEVVDMELGILMANQFVHDSSPAGVRSTVRRVGNYQVGG